MTEAKRAALIVYDGECVFCNSYVRMLELRDAVGRVELVDARSNDPRVGRLKREGYDLNEGMVFRHGDRTYHGDEAVHALALLSSRSSFFNRLNAAVLSNRRAAGLLYPALKMGRRIVLRLRGRDPIPQDLAPVRTV